MFPLPLWTWGGQRGGAFNHSDADAVQLTRNWYDSLEYLGKGRKNFTTGKRFPFPSQATCVEENTKSSHSPASKGGRGKYHRTKDLRTFEGWRGRGKSSRMCNERKQKIEGSLMFRSMCRILCEHGPCMWCRSASDNYSDESSDSINWNMPPTDIHLCISSPCVHFWNWME